MADVDAMLLLPEGPAREAALGAVQREITAIPRRDSVAKEWLKWPTRRRFATLPRLAGVLARLLLTEWRLFVFKRLKLYLRQEPVRDL
jgi:hypothetical protein